jgi:hypothetical protein
MIVGSCLKMQSGRALGFLFRHMIIFDVDESQEYEHYSQYEIYQHPQVFEFVEKVEEWENDTALLKASF